VPLSVKCFKLNDAFHWSVEKAGFAMNVPTIAYITPVLRYDRDARVPVIEYRDAETGKVDLQIPGERTLKAYREAAVNPSAETKVADAPEQAPAASR
jgi:hypothetical protein